jgi:hypothetical protein
VTDAPVVTVALPKGYYITVSACTGGEDTDTPVTVPFTVENTTSTTLSSYLRLSPPFPILADTPYTFTCDATLPKRRSVGQHALVRIDDLRGPATARFAAALPAVDWAAVAAAAITLDTKGSIDAATVTAILRALEALATAAAGASVRVQVASVSTTGDVTRYTLVFTPSSTALSATLTPATVANEALARGVQVVATGDWTATTVAGACLDSEITAGADETDVDCGGSLCAPCLAGSACVVAGDCLSGLCLDATCRTNGALGPAASAVMAVVVAVLAAFAVF